jgi:hypothetical protein
MYGSVGRSLPPVREEMDDSIGCEDDVSVTDITCNGSGLGCDCGRRLDVVIGIGLALSMGQVGRTVGWLTNETEEESGEKRDGEKRGPPPNGPHSVDPGRLACELATGGVIATISPVGWMGLVIE